jgi:(1->4)-alpha-D-glucan 1-alpha-D-glucosylmutase
LARDLLQHYNDGRVKLYVTHCSLVARKQKRDLFLRGDYEALASGDHVIAFTRGYKSDRLVCCVPRLSYVLTRGERPWPLRDVWKAEQLRLPDGGTYRDVFTGALFRISGSLRLSELFADFPVALLLRET